MSKDKDDMSTAVTTSAPEESRGSKTGSELVKPGGWTVFKPGEGYATRLGLMVVVLAYVVFAARQWYYNWKFVPRFFKSLGLDFLLGWTDSYQSGVQTGGMLLLAGAGLAMGYYYIYVRRDSAEFLVKTDTELAKVTWPKISPWFRPETQVWGATYVVLIVLAFLTFYVLAVDSILELFAKTLFFSK